MDVEVASVASLRFVDGSPVHAASAVVRLGDGWLVVQDDSTIACWWRDDAGHPLRLLPSIEGHDDFTHDADHKELKPDLEAALRVPGGVLLLGSGSTPARMRSVLLDDDNPDEPFVADLSPLYADAAAALDVPVDQLNMEGACVLDGRLRWFHRGLPGVGTPTGSIDLDLDAVLAAARAEPWSRGAAGNPLGYDLGEAEGVGLAITDAVALDDGRILVSAAAEDTPNPYDDGPVVGSALALLDGETVVESCPLPRVDGHVAKVEGLVLVEWSEDGGRLLGSVDQDEPETPSSLLTLDVTL